MSRFVSFRRSAVALAVVAVLGLAGPATAAEQVPFHGFLAGDVTRTPVPPVVLVDISATGTATQLGQFTLEIPHVVDPVARTAVGSYQFVAANGDTLYAYFTGRATSTPVPGVLYIEETAVIDPTRSTGRFAGATGGFTVGRLFDTITSTTVGSFSGSISSPGAGNP